MLPISLHDCICFTLDAWNNYITVTHINTVDCSERWGYQLCIGKTINNNAPRISYTRSLDGNILTIDDGDLIYLGVLAVAVTTFYVIYRRLVVLVAFDEDYARSLRLPVTLFKYVMTVSISLAVVSCIRIAGIVLTLSMLTVPVMTAMLFTTRYSRIIVLSVIICFVTCVSGLGLAYQVNIPSGTSIIFLSIILYAVIRLSRRFVCKGNKSAV